MSKVALNTFFVGSLLLLVFAVGLQFRSKDLCISSNNIVSVKGPGFDIQNCHEPFRPFISSVPSFVPSVLRDLETFLNSPFWYRKAAVKIQFVKVDTPLEAEGQLLLPESWLGQDTSLMQNALLEHVISKHWPKWQEDHFQFLVLRDFLKKVLKGDMFYEFQAPNSNFIRSLQSSSELCNVEKSNPLCTNQHWTQQSPKILTIWHFHSLLVEMLYEAYRDSSLFEKQKVLAQIARGVESLPTPSLPKDLREIQDWRQWLKDTMVDFGQSLAFNEEQLRKILYLKGVSGDFGLDTLVIVSSQASTEFKHKLKESLQKKLGRGPWLVVDDQPSQHSPFLLARAQGLRLRQVISYQCGGQSTGIQAQSYYVQQFDLIQDCE